MSTSAEIIVISGPSGVGKGTVCQKLLERVKGLKLSVSATSRAIRENEIDGVHYHFKTEQGFQAMIENDELLEWARYNDSFYGTPWASVESPNSFGDGVKRVLLEIDTQGALMVKDRFGPDALLIFIEPPSFEALRDRLVGRGTNDSKDIEGRLEIAKGEMALTKQFDIQVKNDDLETCVEQIQALISG